MIISAKGHVLRDNSTDCKSDFKCFTWQKVTTLIDLNYLQGLQARFVICIAEIKHQACKEQTRLKSRLSYIAVIVACCYFVGVCFHSDLAGYRKLSR